MSGDAQIPVQRPLTLILPIKSPDDFQKLAAFLKAAQGDPSGPLRRVLDGIGTVHFARFVFLENNTKLAVITTYDGDLETYLHAFADQLEKEFNTILGHIESAPTNVRTHRREFIEFIMEHDVPAIEPFYSAYPHLTVKQIRALDTATR
jgi:hypothetical protein